MASAPPSVFKPKDPQILYVAKYKCDKCGHKWKVRRTSGGKKSCPIKSCSSYIPVSPYKMIPINKLVVYKCPTCQTEEKRARCEKEVNNVPYCRVCRCNMEVVSCKDLKKLKRLFGEFFCSNCNRDWKSGNSWEGKGQECKKCERLVYPHSLRPLQPPQFTLERKEPHDQERCQMCKERGQNCKTIDSYEGDVASNEELPEEDEDNLSVVTDTSSAISNTSSTRERSSSSDNDDLDDDNLSLGDGGRTPTGHNSDQDEDQDDLVTELTEMTFNNKKK